MRRGRRCQFEVLEPRILLSADPLHLAVIDQPEDLLAGPPAEVAIVAEGMGEEAVLDRTAEDAAVDTIDDWVFISEVDTAAGQVETSGDRGVVGVTGSTAGGVTPGRAGTELAPAADTADGSNAGAPSLDRTRAEAVEVVVLLPLADRPADEAAPNFGDYGFQKSTDVPGDSLARGPPRAADQTTTLDRKSQKNRDFAPQPTKEEGAVDEFALSQDAVDRVFQEAIRQWSALGLTPQTLASVQLAISDLPGRTVALNQGSKLTVDRDAAGHEWFVDPTPGDSTEFGAGIGSPILKATPGSPAYGRMDLLTVLTHEVGHVLGLEDSKVGDQPSADGMSGVLLRGRRVGVEGPVSWVSLAQWNASPTTGAILSGSILDLSLETADLIPTVDLLGNVAVSGSTPGTDGIHAGIGQIIGGSGRDSLYDPNAPNIWTLTGPNPGTLNSIGFSSIERLFGGGDEG